jgi:hypothetical protein
MSDFTPCDPATWPATLTLEQVSAIYQKSADVVRHGCTPKARKPFVPQPFDKRPLRWRKVDVLRNVEGRRVA